MNAPMDPIQTVAVAFARWLMLAALILLLTSCITLTEDPRALVPQPDGGIKALTLTCPLAEAALREGRVTRPLDPQSIRLVTWNIHKQDDAGWQKDLWALASTNDLVLLQETSLRPELLDILHAADLRWVMASSFEYGGADLGVLTAFREAPLASCTQRVVEPLLRLPKSAVITWFALAGETRPLAVVNVHAINFSLSIDAYRAQFAALTDAVASHDGPIILAGDFNTWTTARRSVIDDVAARLALTEVGFVEDKRTLFFGNQLDHILVRGLRAVAATAVEVNSSDHNPVTVVLRRPAQ
jgi:endonuclease/exonuclease/phosphatase (EEP) superfamily protein YafD